MLVKKKKTFLIGGFPLPYLLKKISRAADSVPKEKSHPRI